MATSCVEPVSDRRSRHLRSSPNSGPPRLPLCTSVTENGTVSHVLAQSTASTRNDGEGARNDRQPSSSRGGAPLRRDLEWLGLGPYEARLLLVLVEVGSANSTQLAELSGVYRTSTYRVMNALTARGLVEVMPGERPTVWTCHSWEGVLDLLETAAEDRLRQHHLLTNSLRQAFSGSEQHGQRAMATEDGRARPPQ